MIVKIELPGVSGKGLSVELPTPAEAIEWVLAARRTWIPEDAWITMIHPSGSRVTL
jgi:hypothetical protein